MSANVMMKCGHAANATNGYGDPCCAICYGIDPGAAIATETPPDLTGREAICVYCKTRVPSALKLAFFSHHTDGNTDGFYCGCRGWN